MSVSPTTGLQTKFDLCAELELLLDDGSESDIDGADTADGQVQSPSDPVDDGASFPPTVLVNSMIPFIHAAPVKS
jgi:hypothetical protein